MCADAAIALHLMAKAPVAGAVKTRLTPRLSAAAAAELARLMLAQTAATAHRHWPGPVALCVTPDPRHPVFAQLAEQYQFAVATQAGADLGARMLAALTAGAGAAAAVMGCDAPHCPGAVLARAHARLARGENVIGPAADGGFYLLGLQRAEAVRAGAALFRGVKWSSADARAQVRARAQAAGVAFRELPLLRDIDRYADLEWLAGEDAAYRRFVAQA